MWQGKEVGLSIAYVEMKGVKGGGEVFLGPNIAGFGSCILDPCCTHVKFRQ